MSKPRSALAVHPFRFHCSALFLAHVSCKFRFINLSYNCKYCCGCCSCFLFVVVVDVGVGVGIGVAVVGFLLREQLCLGFN